MENYCKLLTMYPESPESQCKIQCESCKIYQQNSQNQQITNAKSHSIRLVELSQTNYLQIVEFLKYKSIVPFDLFSPNQLGSIAFKADTKSETFLVFAVAHIIAENYNNYTGFIHAGIRVNGLNTIIRERNADFDNATPLNIAGKVSELILKVLGKPY